VATITFSGHKQKIAEFAAQTLNFARQDGGLLLTAEGEMQFQDTASVENMLASYEPYHVAIEKDGETVIDQPFRLTFYTLELDTLAVLLQQ
jgi:hypothetical protein